MGESAKTAVPGFKRVYTPEIPDHLYCEIDSASTLWLVSPKRGDGFRDISWKKHDPRNENHNPQRFVGTVEKAPGMGGVIRIIPQDGGMALRVSKYLLYRLKMKRRFNRKKRAHRYHRNLFVRRV